MKRLRYILYVVFKMVGCKIP